MSSNDNRPTAPADVLSAYAQMDNGDLRLQVGSSQRSDIATPQLGSPVASQPTTPRTPPTADPYASNDLRTPRVSTEFSRRVRLAFRLTISAALGTIPVVVSQLNETIVPSADPTFAAVVAVLVMGENLGETNYLCFLSTMGVILPAILIFLTVRLFGNGLAAIMPVGMLVCFVVSYLDLPSFIKKFTLGQFVFYCIDLLSPSPRSTLDSAWNLVWWNLWGCGCGIIAISVSPVLASKACKAAVLQIASEMGRIAEVQSRWYAEAQTSVYFSVKAQKMRDRLTALQSRLTSQLDHMWWEPHNNAHRARMLHFAEMTLYLLRCQRAMAAAVRESKYRASHVRCVQAIEPESQKLREAMAIILNSMAENVVSSDGRYPREVFDQLKQMRDALTGFRKSRDMHMFADFGFIDVDDPSGAAGVGAADEKKQQQPYLQPVGAGLHASSAHNLRVPSPQSAPVITSAPQTSYTTDATFAARAPNAASSSTESAPSDEDRVGRADPHVHGAALSLPAGSRPAPIITGKDNPIATTLVAPAQVQEPASGRARKKPTLLIRLVNLSYFTFNIEHMVKLIEDAVTIDGQYRVSWFDGIPRGVPPVLFDRDTAIVAFKVMLSLLLTSILAVVRYNYSSVGPITIAYIIGAHVGGSYNIVVNRLQGVVLASITSYAVIVSFELNPIATGVSTCTLVFLFGYVRFSREPNESYIGLVAAFMVPVITLADYGGNSTAVVRTAVILRIENTMLAVFIFLLVEMFILPSRAEGLLWAELRDVLRIGGSIIKTAVSSYTADDCVKCQLGAANRAYKKFLTLDAKLATAASLHAEAANEPPLWRPMFAANVVKNMLDDLQEAKLQIIMLIRCLEVGSQVNDKLFLVGRARLMSDDGDHNHDHGHDQEYDSENRSESLKGIAFVTAWDAGLHEQAADDAYVDINDPAFDPLRRTLGKLCKDLSASLMAIRKALEDQNAQIPQIAFNSVKSMASFRAQYKAVLTEYLGRRRAQTGAFLLYFNAMVFTTTQLMAVVYRLWQSVGHIVQDPDNEKRYWRQLKKLAVGARVRPNSVDVQGSIVKRSLSQWLRRPTSPR